MADMEQLYTALRNADAAGDTAAATKLANYIRSVQSSSGPQASSATATMPAPEKRGFLDELGHQAGLTLRAGVNGIASVPAMMSDAVTGPINAGLDAVAGKGNGFRFQRAADALNNVMDASGVAKPENAKERVVQDIASSMAGAGSMASAGKALANASGPVTSAVGDMLAAGPGLQVASAATGAGASGVTREEGGSPTAQAVAGVLGSLAPIGVAAAKNSAGGTRQLAEIAKTAHDAGYVIPPKDLNPTAVDEVLSGVGGKIKTAQVASERNQQVTNDLVKKALGLQPAATLDLDALKAIRQNAAEAYKDVAGAGVITPTTEYSQAIDAAVQPYLSQAKSFPNRKLPALVEDIQSLKSPQFDTADALATIRVLRNDADAAYRAGDKMAGAAYKNASSALEDAIDQHLTTSGAPADLLQAYRDARQTIAQTFTVQKALNPVTGNVNAQVLAKELGKGVPLSDELRTVAEVAQAFPKATQALKEAPGSISALDVATAGVKAAAKNSVIEPIATLGARPGARALMLSPGYQARSVEDAGPNMVNAMAGAGAAAVGTTTRSANDLAAGKQRDNRLIPLSQRSRPISTVNDVLNAGSVDEAIAHANSVANSKPTKPVGPANISQTPAPEPVKSEDVDAVTRQEIKTSLGDAILHRENGPISIKGDPAALKDILQRAGISSVQTRDGVLIGASQARKAREIFGSD